MDREQKVLELIRSAAKPRRQSAGVTVHGNGNILGDRITINGIGPQRLSPGRKRVLEASAITYIRRTCRQIGDPLLYERFAISEFGACDLEDLTLPELERIRGWVAAQDVSDPR